MFYCEQVGATPDILVIGKGLGGGVMPMAAIIARRESDVAPGAAIGHYTHEKSPLGAAAALATLDVIAQEGLLVRATALGRHGLERLAQVARRHAIFGAGAVRGVGLCLALELTGPAAEANADRLLYACLGRGLSFKLGAGRIVTLCPPLTIEQAQFDRAIDVIEAAAHEIA